MNNLRIYDKDEGARFLETHGFRFQMKCQPAGFPVFDIHQSPPVRVRIC